MLDATRELYQTGVILVVFLQLSVIFNPGWQICITFFKKIDSLYHADTNYDVVGKDFIG